MEIESLSESKVGFDEPSQQNSKMPQPSPETIAARSLDFNEELMLTAPVENRRGLGQLLLPKRIGEFLECLSAWDAVQGFVRKSNLRVKVSSHHATESHDAVRQGGAFYGR